MTNLAIMFGLLIVPALCAGYLAGFARGHRWARRHPLTTPPTIIIGGVAWQAVNSMWTKTDDRLKLWGDDDGRWKIVMCVDLTEWNIDHWYWTGTGWTLDDEKAATYPSTSLSKQVALAWKRRNEAGR